MISRQHLLSRHRIALISATSKLLLSIRNKSMVLNPQVPKLSQSLHCTCYSYLRNRGSTPVNPRSKGTSRMIQKSYFSIDAKRCWNCQSIIDPKDVFFCSSCTVIQPPDTNLTFFGYFDRYVRFCMQLGIRCSFKLSSLFTFVLS